MAFRYPVCLNLQNKRCVLIGGGQVAARKLASLLQQQAKVTLVSPQIVAEIAAEYENASFEWLQSVYEPAQLDGAFLVIAATDKREVNRQIGEYCNEHNILVNVIDSPAESSFSVNASFSRGDLLVAISTNGASPAISRKIRQDLEALIGEEYAQALEIAAQARSEAMEKIADKDKRREFLQSLAAMDLVEQLQHSTIDTVRKRVKACLLAYLD